jgi:beta-mannosidase
MYWLRILKALADPEARKRWQAGPVPENVTQTGPWLKPQVQATSTSLRGTAKFENESPKETSVSITVTNEGKVPAYPLRIELEPDTYSTLWEDNYFWLAPGETITIQGTVRLDMSGLDAITNPPVAKTRDLVVRVSAWNTAPIELRPA